MKINYEMLKNKIYAKSPYDLATDEDNAYRDGVDDTLKIVFDGGIMSLILN